MDRVYPFSQRRLFVLTWFAARTVNNCNLSVYDVTSLFPRFCSPQGHRSITVPDAVPPSGHTPGPQNRRVSSSCVAAMDMGAEG
jgi:hypothetical protein